MKDVWPPLVTLIIGGVITWIATRTIKGSVAELILNLEDKFVLRRECEKQHENDARERQYIRNDIERIGGYPK